MGRCARVLLIGLYILMVPLASLGQQGEVRMVLGGGVHKLFSDYTDDLYGPFGAASLLYAPADRLELEFRYGLGKGRWIVTPSALAAYPDYFGPKASIGDFYPGSTTRIEQENEVRLSAFDLMLRYVLVKDIAATPFIYAGVSLLNYMPSTGDSHESLPNAADEVYSTSAFSVPIGAGVRIPISDRFGLELRGEYRFTMTEFLDDVNFNGSNDAITSFGVGFTYLFNEPQPTSVSGANTPTGTRTVITRRTTTVITDKTVKSHTHSTRTDCDCKHQHVHTCCCCCCTKDPCSDKHRGGGTGTGRDTVTIRDTIKIPCPPDTCPPGYRDTVINGDTLCIKNDTITRIKCPEGFMLGPDLENCIPDTIPCEPGSRPMYNAREHKWECEPDPDCEFQSDSTDTTKRPPPPSPTGTCIYRGFKFRYWHKPKQNKTVLEIDISPELRYKLKRMNLKYIVRKSGLITCDGCHDCLDKLIFNVQQALK